MEKKNQNHSKVNNWYADRYNSLILQRNFLAIVVLISSVACLASLFIIKFLYSQKVVDPYLIEVNKKTNVMSIVDNVSKKQFTAQESIKEYFFVKYLKAREGYVETTLESDSEVVRVLSSPALYKAYLDGLSARTLAMSKFGKDAKVDIKIKSISYLTEKRVDIKFSKITESKESARKEVGEFSLLIGFDFVDMDMSLSDLHINPLGFQVQSYFLNESKLLND